MGLGGRGVFAAGHLLDARSRAFLDVSEVERVLSPTEAAALIERFQRAAERKPPAPSIRRPGSAQTDAHLGFGVLSWSYPVPASFRSCWRR